MQFVVSPGPVELFAGASSTDLPLSGELRITGPPLVLSERRTFFSTTSISKP
jgi:hypothetical protein